MSTSKPQKICTVILEYQNPRMTLSTVKSLQKAVLPPDFTNKIVVIDNSPVPDGTLAKFCRENKDIKLITSLQNTGFSKGNNMGISYGLKIGCQFFLLVNNDVKIHKQLLSNLIAGLKTGADIVVPKIYFAKGHEFHSNRYQSNQLGKVIWYAGGQFDWANVYSKHIGMDEVDTGQFDSSQEIEFATFCCVLIKKEVFKEIGLLDEKYFLYWEDGDFSVRALNFGFKIIFEPKAVAWHKSSDSSGAGSKLHDYYLTRNRLIFGFKYASFRTKLALIKESIKKILKGRPGEKQGIIDFCLRRLGKGRNL